MLCEKTEEKIQIKGKIKHNRQLLQSGDLSIDSDLDRMFLHVDLLTKEIFQQILHDNLPQLIMDFHAPLPNHEKEVVELYKQDLLRQVETGIADCLKSNLSIQLTNYIRNSQYSMQQQHNCQLHPLQQLDPYIDFPEKLNIQETAFIREPVRFEFSLSPKNIQERFRGKQILPFLNPINESWSSRLKIIITAAAVVNESQLAVAGLVLKCFGSSKAAVRILTSIGLLYCGLYLFERTVWALKGKEKQIKMAALSFATSKLNLMQSCITSSMKSQVQYQMKSFLDNVKLSVEKDQTELVRAIENIEDEVNGLQFTVKSCANLSNSLQGVLFDLDAFERTLWKRMEPKQLQTA